MLPKQKSFFARIALAALVICFLQSPGHAQALAERLPADSMVYIGWCGADAMPPGYGDSHLKAFLDSSKIPALLQDSVPQLMQAISRREPQVAQAWPTIASFTSALWRHPWALCYDGIAVQQPNGAVVVTPKIDLICHAGADADALVQQANDLLGQLNILPFPITAANEEGYVIVGTFVLPSGGAMLSDDPTFKAAMAHFNQAPALSVYINAQALVNSVESMSANSPNADQVSATLAGLHLHDYTQISVAGGFEGRDWTLGAYVGLKPESAQLKEAKALPDVSPEALTMVPASATMGGVSVLSLPHLLADMRSGVQGNPDAANQFEQTLSQLNQMLGIDIEKDLADTLGAQWSWYVDPNATGNGIGGITILNKPSDADHLGQALATLEQHVNQLAAQSLAGAGVSVQIRDEQAGDLQLHYLDVPMVAPTWTIKNSTLYLGLYPQAVVAAADAPAGAGSITDNPAWQDMRKRLGAPDAVKSIGYANLPAYAAEGYQSWLFVSRILQGYGDMFGMQSPALALPQLNQITAQLNPAGFATWVDDTGFHAKSITPFPGAETLASGAGIQSMGVGESALMVSILLPSLNRARETANRVKCASNERQIGQAILLYSNDNKGKYPPDLGTLVKTEDIDPMAFICPDDNAPPLPPNATPDEQAAWVNANSSYIYVGSGMNNNIDPGTVVLYEKPGDHHDGMNILFGDGHVEFDNNQGARKLLDDQGLPWPK